MRKAIVICCSDPTCAFSFKHIPQGRLVHPGLKALPMVQADQRGTWLWVIRVLEFQRSPSNRRKPFGHEFLIRHQKRHGCMIQLIEGHHIIVPGDEDSCAVGQDAAHRQEMRLECNFGLCICEMPQQATKSRKKRQHDATVQVSVQLPLDSLWSWKPVLRFDTTRGEEEQQSILPLHDGIEQHGSSQ